MSAPSMPTARIRRLFAATTVLSLVLSAGVTLSAAAAPDNPLAPEVTSPELNRAGSGVGDKLEQLEEAFPEATKSAPAAPAAAPPALADPITSSRFVGYAYPGCAAGGRTATVRAAVQSKKSRTLRWVLTNGGGVNKTGEIRVKGSKSKLTEFSIAGLPAGAYRLDFRRSSSSKVSVRVPVLVLACVQATASCRGVTFTNPASNPGVELDYSPADDDEGDSGFFSLEPGASRFVRTDSVAVTWSAYGFTETTESSAGEVDSLGVPQACIPPDPVPGDNSLVSYVFSDCRPPGGATATVELGFERLRDIAVRFEVRNAADGVVLQGSATASNEAVGALPAGSYRYRTYVNGATTAYEDVSFTVLECVRVTRTCKSATFTNPNLGRLEIGYATKTGKHSRQLVLAGKSAAQVKWKYKNLRWFAFPAESDLPGDELATQVFSFAGEGLQVRPKGC